MSSVFRHQLKDSFVMAKYEAEPYGSQDELASDKERCPSKCHLPCYELKYDITTEYVPPQTRRRSKLVQVEFPDSDYLQELRITEKPAYSLVSVISNIGGCTPYKLWLLCHFQPFIYYFSFFQFRYCQFSLY